MSVEGDDDIQNTARAAEMSVTIGRESDRVLQPRFFYHLRLIHSHLILSISVDSLRLWKICRMS